MNVAVAGLGSGMFNIPAVKETSGQDRRAAQESGQRLKNKGN